MAVSDVQNVLLPQVAEFLAEPKELFIDGKFRPSASGRTFVTLDPATGATVAEVAEAEAADVDAAVHAARRALGPWSSMRPNERGQLLSRLADLVEEHAAVFGQLDCLDNGKPARFVEGGDVPLAFDALRYFAGWVTKIEGRTIPTGFPDMHVYTQLEPVGVVGAIIPWNFPLTQACWKIAPALAAGCTVVLKPAEQTPLSALLLARLIAEVGIPPGVVNVCPGYGETAGAALVEHPGVDKISFTGSVAVGREIARRGADTLKHVSLELGGKSPNIILEDADVATAAATAASAIFYYSGQVCSAGSRLMVHRDVYDDVLSGVVDTARALRVGPGLSDETDLGPLVSDEQVQRVRRYIDLGLEAGASLAYEGERPNGQSGGHFVEPVVFSEVPDDLTIVQEEIFGPVLVAQSFGSIEEVAERANQAEYGLSAGIWTTDLRNAHRLADMLQSGTVWVNCYNYFDAATPWGGYKQSGYGRDCGWAAVEKYLQIKTVWTNLA